MKHTLDNHTNKSDENIDNDAIRIKREVPFSVRLDPPPFGKMFELSHGCARNTAVALVKRFIATCGFEFFSDRVSLLFNNLA